ncbi:sensor histidine kinase [Agromyces aurantiacus]|uniref:Sensor histidine kinase n=1 Tax=Agromyces aurantiacus TaxID=165814 RepID=A0ABV9R9X9_9MICO|nr:histidine kinase [Agromyces aurantiacus]MBM7503642.1 two-component system LytT family sensor kinase [Agromyces aurantiacus]
MIDDAWLPILVGVGIGIALTLLLQVVWRLARGSRDLGSDVERATFRTLSLASRAAVHLRGGLGSGDPQRAARALRSLLGSDAIAIADTERILSVDGRPGLSDAAWQVASSVVESGRRQVSGAPSAPAVGAPVVVHGRTVGAIVAFADRVRPPLVRATAEVARWCGRQLELGELETSRAALAEAELRALRAQISPHFIYNSLGAIASYISTDPERAKDLVLDFADFTRYSFRRQGEFTTLAEELRSVHSYVELERARFEERLTVTLQVEPETLATVIPFLSVQPLVENAVRHGLEPRERGGTIVIGAHDDGTHTEITVDDDGVGMSPDELRGLLTAPGRADHVGLRNVDSRLRRIYGDDHALVVETNPGAGTLVRMRIPKSQPFHETERPSG